MRLEPFSPSRAGTVLGWIRSHEEADAWASVAADALDPSVFDRWHADPDTRAFVALEEGRPLAYGELWLEPEEAELARIVVDPEARGRGIGRRVVRLLAAEALRLGRRQIWLRVVPLNEPALACYRAAGFARSGEAEEAALNAGQPRAYAWMRHQPPGGVVVAVSRSESHTMSKLTQDAVRLVAGLGVAGDAHAGETVKHRSRVRRDPTEPNLRQVHLIHAELHDELRAGGFDLRPGEMGENVTTRGVDLLALPAGTLLRLGGEALIEVTGLRNPCVQLDGLAPGLMAANLDRDEHGELVRKTGVMGVVVAGGEVRAGDAIDVELPAPPHRPLRPV